MTSLKKTFLSLAAAAALGSLAFAIDSSTPASSSGPESAPIDDARTRMERLTKFAAERLDLTDEQINALKNVLRLHQSELQPLTERARTEREGLRAIVAAESLDEAALAAQADKIAETTKALTIASAHMHADLRAILTSEQIDKLMQARRHMAERRQHGRRALSARSGE